MYSLGASLLAVYAIWRLVVTLRDDSGGGNAGWVLGLLIAVAVFAVFDFRNSARARRVRESCPEAFVSNIIVYRPLLEVPRL
jgi:hypothetical protein